MTEPTMRERVARALCAAQGLRWEDQKNFATSANGGDNETDFYFTMADAAIEAMREPTDDMVQGGYEAERQGWPDEPGYCVAPADCWRAMIDVALAEKADG